MRAGDGSGAAIAHARENFLPLPLAPVKIPRAGDGAADEEGIPKRDCRDAHHAEEPELSRSALQPVLAEIVQLAKARRQQFAHTVRARHGIRRRSGFHALRHVRRVPAHVARAVHVHVARIRADAEMNVMRLRSCGIVRRAARNDLQPRA